MVDDRSDAGVLRGQAVAPRRSSDSTDHAALAGPHVSFPRRDPAERGVARKVQLAARKVEKSYAKGQNIIPVLRRVDLEIRSGEFLSIVGQSGSGKSTLIHLMGTLDRPDAGEIWLDDKRIDNVSTKRRDALRNEYFGMIFQSYHLLPELTAVDNVLTPLMIGCSTLGYLRNRHTLRRRAKELLEAVGLGHRLNHKPSELSGGEMQRTAIARALVNRPRVLLADEPTGNLDHKTGWEILKILRSLNEQQNLTIVMVTHDEEIANQADRSVRLVEGRVERA
ncbi:MAG: ABC transporter ATP-binding protein [Pirellulales bacterium]